MRAEAFIIHLARTTQRRRQVDTLLAELPLPGRVLDAVDGATLDTKAVTAFYRRQCHRPRYPFELSRAEVACFLSHRAAWRAIVEQGLDAGLIVEDDVEVGPGFAAVLADVAQAAAPRDYLRFPRWERGESGKTVRTGSTASVIEPFLPALGMQAQFVGREAARLLLAATETFDRPVDSIVQMQWLHGARVLSVRPIVIREIDRELGGTVLQKKNKGILERLNRELRRPLMRAAVRRANARWRARQEAG